MSDITLPPYFLRETGVTQLIDASSPEIIIPYQFYDDDDRFIHSFIWIDGGVLVCMVFDPTQHRWQELCRYELTHDPRTDWTTPWVGDVLFIGDDASTARIVHDQLAQAYNHFYEDEPPQMPAMPSSDPPAISDRHPSCSCQSSISAENVM